MSVTIYTFMRQKYFQTKIFRYISHILNPEINIVSSSYHFISTQNILLINSAFKGENFKKYERYGMTAGKCSINKYFHRKYIGKYLSVEILLTRECISIYKTYLKILKYLID